MSADQDATRPRLGLSECPLPPVDAPDGSGQASALTGAGKCTIAVSLAFAALAFGSGWSAAHDGRDEGLAEIGAGMGAVFGMALGLIGVVVGLVLLGAGSARTRR